MTLAAATEETPETSKRARRLTAWEIVRDIAYASPSEHSSYKAALSQGRPWNALNLWLSKNYRTLRHREILAEDERIAGVL